MARRPALSMSSIGRITADASKLNRACRRHSNPTCGCVHMFTRQANAASENRKRLRR
jgi:hypothetical protein